MKKLLLLLLSFNLTLSNAQEFKSANEYLTYIGNETNRLTQSIWEYTSAIAHTKNIEQINEKKNQLLIDSKIVAEKIKNLKNGYKGDIEYRNQLLEYLSLIDSQINAEFNKMFYIESGFQKSFEEIEKYSLDRNKENEKIKEEVEKLNENQKVFAKKYNIIINENKSEISLKMKISNDVFNYHTQLYLIFLKLNVSESDFINAISKNDLLTSEKKLAELVKNTDESFEKHSKISSFNSDSSLLDKTKNLLDFMKKEVTEFGPVVISYLKKRQELEDVKIATSGKTQLSEIEVEIYNNVAKEKNMSFKNYMRINDFYNSERESITKDWNNSGDLFIATHVPKN